MLNLLRIICLRKIYEPHSCHSNKCPPKAFPGTSQKWWREFSRVAGVILQTNKQIKSDKKNYSLSVAKLNFSMSQDTGVDATRSSTKSTLRFYNLSFLIICFCMTHGPRCAQSLRHDLKTNIHSVNRYTSLIQTQQILNTQFLRLAAQPKRVRVS